MAIKKPTPKPEKTLPASLQTLADEALMLQIANTRYETKYKAKRVEFIEALEADEQTEATIGETFKHQSGTFRFDPARKSVDAAKLVAAVKAGKATWEQVLYGAVSMFNVENLKNLGLGEAVESNEDKKPILTFRASADYKAKVSAELAKAEEILVPMNLEEVLEKSLAKAA